MFGPLKEALGGGRQCFDDDEQVENFVRKWLHMRPPSFYDAGIKWLPICWQKCIEKGGNYVEKWIFLFCKIMFQQKIESRWRCCCLSQGVSCSNWRDVGRAGYFKDHNDLLLHNSFCTKETWRYYSLWHLMELKPHTWRNNLKKGIYIWSTLV
jgi:hypothetical protein